MHKHPTTKHTQDITTTMEVRMAEQVAGVGVKVVSRVIVFLTNEFLPNHQKTHVSIISFKQLMKRMTKNNKYYQYQHYETIPKPLATDFHGSVSSVFYICLCIICGWVRVVKGNANQRGGGMIC